MTMAPPLHRPPQALADPRAAPVQRAVPGGTRFGWAVWSRGGGSTNGDRNLAAIAAGLDRFHRGRGEFRSDQAYADNRAAGLDQATRGVHAYLAALGDLGETSLARDYMLDLLDELQEAHVEQVEYVNRNDLELYSATPLGRRGRRELNAAWNAIRRGTGAIRLPGGRENEADNRSTRAAFARLLSRPTGRALVKALLDQSRGAYRLNVGYTDRLSPEEQGRREANRAEYRRLNERYTALRAGGGTEEEVLAAHQALMPFLDEVRPDFRNMAANEPAAASKDGGNARLRVLRGLKDSENLNHSGVNRGLIASSAHVVLGHELVHALHYKRGEDDPGNPDDYARGTALHHWGNAEERRTIATGRGPTENRLRAEHGLPAREGHTGVARRTLQTGGARLLGEGLRTAAAASLLLAANYARFPVGADME